LRVETKSRNNFKEYEELGDPADGAAALGYEDSAELEE
jgi:hypothetical protein